LICALIHGFGGDPAAWDDVVAAWQLPDWPRTIALPGHGGGPVLDTWDANLDAIAEAVDSQRCDCVVGYSLGARVALGLVAGGRVGHGVFIGVNPGITDDMRADRAQVDAAWARLLRTEGVAAFDDAWTKQALFATQARVPEAKRAARRERRLRHDPEQLARSLEVMGLAAMPDYWSAVAPHRDRIALIAGADDAKYVAIAEGLPSASFETIPDSGHDPTLEQPAALAAAIARAVQRLR
jgi:2-succinyl-6-hydroxy-2,4-cyclohexadiene-1-carboxylate synthase